MLEGSFAGFFRSATAGFRNVNPDDAELETGAYVKMDQDAQNEYDSRWQAATPVRDAFRSAAGLFGFQAEAEPPKKVGFLQGARENGLVRTLTPGFLRNEQDDDYASTCCPSMGFKQRLFGCACCFAAGQLLQFIAFGSAAGVLIGHPGRFARCYSMGNIMMVTGSFFLSGPKRQCNKIREKDRLPTFCAFILSSVLTLWVVFAHAFWGRALLIIFAVVIQWCAQVWYILSYVPYGHTVGRRVIKKVMACCCTW